MNVQITTINADIANIKAMGVSQVDHKQLSDGIKQEVDLIKKAIETNRQHGQHQVIPNYNTITSSKAIMEFKAISNLRSLKSKGEFRLWNERLLSALDQARPGLHQMLEAGTIKLDIGEKYMDDKKWDEQLTSVHGSQRAIKPYLEYHEVRRDLHCLLQDKCEDPEGLSRIRAAKGDGIKAYFDMYSWYLGRSGQELQSRAEFIMSPPVPKTEGEIAATIDKWREQYNFVKNYQPGWSLAKSIPSSRT